MLRALVVCFGVAGCVSPVMTFGEGKTAKQAQRDTMNDMGPARLAPTEKWKGEVTTRKVRVWANSQYRAQNIRWQESFEEPLELANVVLTPIFGLRLVAEYAVWDRNVPGATLHDEMQALAEHDPGNDVFAVIGLTSSLPLVSSTFDELGLAALGGRHIVLRGYADLEERKLYADAFPDLRAEERELALVHVRHHKSAVVLLHELGHVLGVGHETNSATIMHAAYSNRATSFSTDARAVMLANVDARVGRASTSPIIASAKPAAVTSPARSPTQVTPSMPSASSAPPTAPTASATPHAPVVIRVTRKRTMLVGGKALDATALDELLRATFAEDPNTKIIISEDRRLPAGIVGDLLDRLKALGFKRVEFAWSGH